MTHHEIEQYCEYGQLPLLESYIEKSEEAFGNKISEITVERTFINLLMRAYPQSLPGWKWPCGSSDPPQRVSNA